MSAVFLKLSQVMSLSNMRGYLELATRVAVAQRRFVKTSDGTKKVFVPGDVLFQVCLRDAPSATQPISALRLALLASDKGLGSTKRIGIGHGLYVLAI